MNDEDNKTVLPGEDDSTGSVSKKGAKFDNQAVKTEPKKYNSLQDRIRQETAELLDATREIFDTAGRNSSGLIQKALDKTIELARKGNKVAKAQIDNINRKFKDQGVVLKIDDEYVASKAFAGCEHCVQYIDLFIPDCSDYSEIRDLVSYERVTSLDAPVFYEKLKDFSDIHYTINENTEQVLDDVLDECVKGEMYALFTSLTMGQKELNTCSNVDKVLTHISKMKKTINKATLLNVLYPQKVSDGKINLPLWDSIWESPRTEDLGVTNFDDVNFLDALANGLMRLVSKTECPISNFTILVHPSVYIKMMNMRDAENRPLFQENGACLDARFNCVRIVQSFLLKDVDSEANDDVKISDVIIGDFSHYSLLEMQIPFVDDYMTEQMNLKIMYKGFASGKVVGDSFAKLQVEYNK